MKWGYELIENTFLVVLYADISRKKRALTKTKLSELTNKAGREFKRKCQSVSGMTRQDT